MAERIKFLGTRVEGNVLMSPDGQKAKLFYGQKVQALIGNQLVPGVVRDGKLEIPITAASSLQGEFEEYQLIRERVGQLFEGQEKLKAEQRRDKGRLF